MTSTPSAAMARAADPAPGGGDTDGLVRQRAVQVVEQAVGRTGRMRARHTRGCPSMADPYLATITGAELATLVGAEAARYALIRQARNPAAPIDIGRWVRPNDDNPIFQVQFAHARLAAVGRYAAALRPFAGEHDDCLGPAETLPEQRAADPAAPSSGEAAATAVLRRVLAEYPQVLANVVNRAQPHRLTRYLERLATAVRDYLCVVRVLPTMAVTADGGTAADDRLQLVADARQILADGLGVLGVSAPERM
ncbi:DALR anticodon-binding domain-containing protein [Nakamurella lactea]|uniref:DALR anticodon-binding domain-containing protein n=1 Tax=Nakamurella lactea TaxID=459515 RepID=UPI0003FA9B05|nr:DALR anticodon-binding domain-containing protein [Nakamurella lactea]